MLTVGGRAMRVVEFRDDCLQTTPFPMNTGTLVVPDEAVSEGARILQSILDVQCASDADEAAFGQMMDAVSDTDNPDTWPITLSMTRADVFDQSISLSTIVAYLAIYLGFVLVVACAAILAIQQLSDASDNAPRYGFCAGSARPRDDLRLALRAGARVLPVPAAVGRRLACALVVVTDAVAVFGHLDITSMALACAGAFLAVYGVYFAVTYLGARKLARE